jgi:hypothetical protein
LGEPQCAPLLADNFAELNAGIRSHAPDVRRTMTLMLETISISIQKQTKPFPSR